ncbi:hypothetical protein BVRB_1g015380 [Beta vulgaris subsp. vulgaris]|nr:hypothetical protein BVRB_1g015380 [Beta vulgaris subsp. vulgaris]
MHLHSYNYINISAWWRQNIVGCATYCIMYSLVGKLKKEQDAQNETPIHLILVHAQMAKSTNESASILHRTILSRYKDREGNS